MRREYLDRLVWPDPDERQRAWRELHLEPTASHAVLSHADRSELAAILINEAHAAVQSTALSILAGYGCAGDGGTGHFRDATGSDDNPLGDWFWGACHKRTVVVRSSDRGYERRDSDAVENLARKLSFKEFPTADIHPLPLGEKGWRQFTREQEFETICVVGRLGLLGQQAVADLENPEARFRFVRHGSRASTKAPGTWKEVYAIHQYENEEFVRDHQFRTSDDVCTDYGIVQRYSRSWGTRIITVLLFAGTSSLGTIGAARWAARDLMEATVPGTNTHIVQQPQGSGPQSRMEALIRTTGDSTADLWRPSQVELLALHVDQLTWSPRDLQWHHLQPHTIEIQLQGGAPVSLTFDGTLTKMKVHSQNFRLAVAIARQVHESGTSVIDIDRLVTDDSIWGDRKLSAAAVKRRLNYLAKEVLRDALTKSTPFRLEAQIKILEV